MRSEADIKEMLDRFDQADEEGNLDSTGSGIRDALLWVIHDYTSSDDLEQHLPECESCGSIACSGANGGTCDDEPEEEEEEDDDVEG